MKQSLVNRTLSLGQIFIHKDVQKILKDVTRFDDRIFARRQVPYLKSPKLVFMTDQQLEKSRESAYDNVKARTQMPPVMEADSSEPRVIARDEEIVGYTQFKIMFVDIGPGYTNRTRLMSVREPDGTLRFPTHAERSRLNNIYFPGKAKSIDEPTMFQDENLARLLKQKEYLFILNRACLEFEPDDPRYVEITTKVYKHINEFNDFDKLVSTRHFGPMAFYLAFNEKADKLIDYKKRKGLKDDAAKIEQLCEICKELSK